MITCIKVSLIHLDTDDFPFIQSAYFLHRLRIYFRTLWREIDFRATCKESYLNQNIYIIWKISFNWFVSIFEIWDDLFTFYVLFFATWCNVKNLCVRMSIEEFFYLIGKMNNWMISILPIFEVGPSSLLLSWFKFSTRVSI
jgi:hypothetical protein